MRGKIGYRDGSDTRAQERKRRQEGEKAERFRGLDKATGTGRNMRGVLAAGLILVPVRRCCEVS
jgi:hypothetical protein